MGKNLDGIVARIRDVRAQKRPEVEKNLQKIDALLAALRDTRGRASAVATRYPDLATALQGISFNEAENSLLKARAVCEAALTRLRRDSINIGVAAKAGQGKSQMLQMLTGLGGDEIPTGGGGACTAVRSIVHNSKAKKAVVHYLTPAGLLEKKVYPSYERIGATPFALGLPGKPSSLDGFLSASLSTVEPANKLPTQGVNNWNDNVIPLQRDLTASPELKLLLGKAPEEVKMEEVHTFLVKDKKWKKHNVVDYVELWTPFEVGLPEGLTVYDLPGLEDPTPGIREDMLESVKSDADVVFFLLKPPTNGERTLWKDEDNNATDMLQSVYPVEEVKPKDWIQLILNEDNREGHKNRGSINLLLGKNADGTPSEIGTSKIPRGFSPVVCDCGSKDAVREMVDANIDALVTQAGHIDDLRIRQADAAFIAAKSAVRSVADALAAAMGPIIAASGGFDEKGNLERFWGDLRAPFKIAIEKQLDGMQEKFKEELKTAFGAAYNKMENIYADRETSPEKEFPREFPVFPKSKLVTFLRKARGTKEVIDRAARNQFGAVVELLRNEMRGCCDHLRAIYLENVVKSVTRDNSAIQSLLRSASDQKFENPEAVFKTLKSRLEESANPVETIVAALDNLLRFDVSYETQLLPYLFDVQEFIDKFDPYSTNSELSGLEKSLDEQFPCDYSAQAEVLFNTLKNYALNWIAPLANSRSEGPCRTVSEGIMRVVKANYRNFIAQFVWGEETELEWEMYVHIHQDSLWPEDYEKAASRSQLGKELRDIVALLRKYVS